jgi:hypothetical protein
MSEMLDIPALLRPVFADPAVQRLMVNHDPAALDRAQRALDRPKLTGSQLLSLAQSYRALWVLATGDFPCPTRVTELVRGIEAKAVPLGISKMASIQAADEVD